MTLMMRTTMMSKLKHLMYDALEYAIEHWKCLLAMGLVLLICVMIG